MRFALVIVLAGCFHPLRPGETRCSSSPLFGSVITDCQTGQPQQVQLAPYYLSGPASPAPPVPVRPAPAAPPARKIVVGDRPLFCMLQPGGAIGLCFIEESTCDGVRSVAVQNGATFGACEVHNAGSCFNYDAVLTGKRELLCSPSISDCEQRLVAMRGNPDAKVTAVQCGIYRQQQEAATTE